MTISMHDASVPVFKQMLNSLSAFLAKAEAHATEKNINADVFLQARVFPDMFPLTRQVQIAADFAKGVCARLANLEVPSYEDNETTFAELQARITKTLAFIENLNPTQFDGSQERQIITGAGTAREKTFNNGLTYLLHYGLPHFYFHTTTVYNILRHNGVEIGKKDFIGAY